MKNTAIRLSVKFFTEVKDFELDSTGRVKAPSSYKITIMKNLEEILGGGMTGEEIEGHFDAFKKKHPKPKEAYDIDDIFKWLGVSATKKEVVHDPNNLMKPGAFYYHPALQVAPGPPIVHQLDDGSFVSSYDNEPFFLEMKDSFTYEDLVDYFHEVMGLKGEGYKQRDVGAFKHMMKSHDLDAMLYTIDAARFYAEDYSKPLPKNPFDVRDYIDEGEATLEGRKNTCYMEGLDRVIPRSAQ